MCGNPVYTNRDLNIQDLIATDPSIWVMVAHHLITYHLVLVIITRRHKGNRSGWINPFRVVNHMSAIGENIKSCCFMVV